LNQSEFATLKDDSEKNIEAIENEITISEEKIDTLKSKKAEVVAIF
jgi:hypothetical protein